MPFLVYEGLPCSNRPSLMGNAALLQHEKAVPCFNHTEKLSMVKTWYRFFVL